MMPVRSALILLALAISYAGVATSVDAQCIDALPARGDTHTGDWFGRALAIDGDTLVVGSHHDDDQALDAGAVYVYRLVGNSWAQEAKLVASDGVSFDNFGSNVSISGDLVAVGTPSNDEVASNVGAVYVFQRFSTTWAQTDKILPQDASPGDRFGTSVVVSGATILVGTPDDDDAAGQAGSIYHYEFNATWQFQGKLLANTAQNGEALGSTLALSGDTLIAAAPNYNGGGVFNLGRVLIFERTANTWDNTGFVIPSDPTQGADFGNALDVEGSRMVVGAWNDAALGTAAGAAYVFEFIAGSWTETQKLLASDGTALDQFGFAVALGTNSVWVTSPYNDDHAESSGKLYPFQETINGWVEQAPVYHPDPTTFDFFGYALALDGNNLAISAPLDDNSGGDSGAVFVLDTTVDCTPEFRRGDCNTDGIIGLNDALYGLNVLFTPLGPAPCIDACDVNDDAIWGLVDMIYLLNQLFLTGSAPPAPYPNCGTDPTPDDLGCLQYDGCP